MKSKRRVVQIGPMSEDPAESVSAVCKALMEGLKDEYDFVPAFARRKYGTTRQAKLNLFNIYYFAKHFLSWVYHLAANRPDVAHYAVSSGWAMEKGIIFLGMARLFGAQTVGHLHSGAFIDHWKTMPAWRRNWALRRLRKLDAMIVLSDSWRETAVTDVGLLPEKVFVVNNPIDSEFERAALRMPMERGETTILSLGIMGRDKGVMEVLQAAKIAQARVRFRLQLAGPEREPNIRQRLQEFIAQHSLAGAIDMKSSVWGEEKIRLFREASIFLLPSYYENFPLVVLEAAAAGHAIITTPVGATPEFFKDGISALFVEPRNSEQLARAIIRLIENPEERYRLGKAAREVFVGRLARATIMESLDRVYQTVLGSSFAKNLPAGQTQHSPGFCHSVPLAGNRARPLPPP